MRYVFSTSCQKGVARRSQQLKEGMIGGLKRAGPVAEDGRASGCVEVGPVAIRE